METTLTLNAFLGIVSLVISAVGIILTALYWMMKTIDQRFADAQKANDRTHADAQKAIDAAHAHMQKAIDAAHAHIGENIKSLERQIEKGLDRLAIQLAAITPRAAAEQTKPPA